MDSKFIRYAFQAKPWPEKVGGFQVDSVGPKPWPENVVGFQIDLVGPPRQSPGWQKCVDSKCRSGLGSNLLRHDFDNSSF